MAENEIIVLNEGYSYMDKDDDSVMVANCTCTLIKSHDCNIIVDTMTPWDGDLLLQSEYIIFWFIHILYALLA